MKPARKTYWHLAAERRLPSDYEIATSRLLYSADRGGLSVEVPTARFQARHSSASRLVSARWDELVDPRATTYTKYVDGAREREAFVGRLLATLEESEHDGQYPGPWLATLGRVISPLRFLCHGLQMAAAYVGQAAPSGRIAVAALFQCGDEIRRIQRLAQRLALLARRVPGATAAGRGLWQTDPRWQPLRRAIEALLVTYDWGEALIALNVCLKPVLDELFLVRLAAQADAARAPLDAQILRALFEDCQWHGAWTKALLELAYADGAPNRQAVDHWIDAWRPTVEGAARAAGELLGLDPRADTGAAPTTHRPDGTGTDG